MLCCLQLYGDVFGDLQWHFYRYFDLWTAHVYVLFLYKGVVIDLIDVYLYILYVKYYKGNLLNTGILNYLSWYKSTVILPRAFYIRLGR